MQNNRGIFSKRIAWQLLFVTAFVFLMEFSIHPLTFGPDRWIHDPAVYRINNPQYLPGDSYSKMAAESGVYPFYANLIQTGERLHLSEERWRQMLYLVSLCIIYFSIIWMSRIFSKDWLITPLIVSLHGYIMILAPPYWLYGKFIQVDGGLAPRSIGVALSFLALYFLLKKPKILPWLLLGVATLIHVSNSLIIFTLFFAAWFCRELLYSAKPLFEFLKVFWLKAFHATLGYLLSGGWFAFFLAFQGSGVSSFSDEKFIWTWIYFRAPYMALTEVPLKFWIIFLIHILVGVVCWSMLRKREEAQQKEALDLLGLIGTGAVVYLFVFYFFSIIFPWLPGFQFYSIRVIYFTYFVTYFFLALLTVKLYPKLLTHFMQWPRGWRNNLKTIGCLLMVSIAFKGFFVLGMQLAQKAPINLVASWERFKHPEVLPTQLPTVQYIYNHPEPFLSPVASWALPPGSPYLPSIVTVKCFGFTRNGLEDWFGRLNSISQGNLQRKYEKQLQKDHLKPVVLDWVDIYRNLSAEDVTDLSEKYRFNLFLTYRDVEYPFEVLVEDTDYRLYRLPK